MTRFQAMIASQTKFFYDMSHRIQGFGLCKGRVQTTTLGRTNLIVSRMGMGSPSRLGKRTGNPDHLAANVASFNRPPLPEADVQRLKHMFRNVVSTIGQSMIEGPRA